VAIAETRSRRVNTAGAIAELEVLIAAAIAARWSSV